MNNDFLKILDYCYNNNNITGLFFVKDTEAIKILYTNIPKELYVCININQSAIYIPATNSKIIIKTSFTKPEQIVGLNIDICGGTIFAQREVRTIIMSRLRGKKYAISI